MQKKQTKKPPVAQELPEKSGLEWGQPENSSDEYGTTTTWTTACGRYRVAKRVSKYLESNPASFYALYLKTIEYDEWADPPHYSRKTGKKLERQSWETTETDSKRAGYYPKHYWSMDSALASCEQYHRELHGLVRVSSNRDEVFRKAVESGLTELPRIAQSAAQSKEIPVARTADKPKKDEPPVTDDNAVQVEAKPRRMGALDAAAQVLAEAHKPMTCLELVAEMAAKGLWSSPNGKTPDRTLGAAIGLEIRKQGSKSRFWQAGKGLFSLVTKR